MIEDKIFETLFPRTKFDYVGMKQVGIIRGEVSELEVEVTADDRPKALIEALDVMQATATYLYNTFTVPEIYAGIAKMQAKNNARGYYLPVSPETTPPGERW